mmetsp:Transcript_38277/g.46230  ORF Transcript_38277/g.46230 Transcript_38277/m.46230 type:complete len:231 (-) Transcript_38277:39-731(-)
MTDDGITPAWYFWSTLCIIIPLSLYFIIFLFRQAGEGEGRRNGENNNSRTALFVYVYCLFMFLYLIFYGSSVLQQSLSSQRKVSKSWWKFRFSDSSNDGGAGDRSIGILIGALVVFGSFSLLVCVMVLSSLVNVDDNGGEEGQFGNPIMLIPLTFLLWTIFCAGFATLILRAKSKNSNDSHSDYVKAESRLGERRSVGGSRRNSSMDDNNKDNADSKERSFLPCCGESFT